MVYVKEMETSVSHLEVFVNDIHKTSNRTNYSIEVFSLQIYLLSPQLAHQQLWSRFINTRGREGHNVPCDLHMEHLNRVLKDCIVNLEQT